VWQFWWGFNKEPYLNLKSHIHDGGTLTGSDDWFLGQGEKTQAKDALRPSEEVIRNRVVPALLHALKTENNNDILTGALIALAKIGDARDETGASAFEREFSRFLSSGSQEVAETAAVAMGILANDASVPTLLHLLQDSPLGRRLVEGNEVSYRTRAFAAYGLGLIGFRTADNTIRQQIVAGLIETLEAQRLSTRDVKVGALIGLGLVPLDIAEAEPYAESAYGQWTTSRAKQIEYCLAFFNDKERHYMIRAHAPTAMARLLDGATAELKEPVASALIEALGKHSKTKQQIQQTCVLALGAIGDADEDPIDEEIRATLLRFSEDGDVQSRNFCMIALAQVGGTPGRGEGDPLAGEQQVRKALLKKLSRGKNAMRPWAGLALGVQGRTLIDNDCSYSADAAAALRAKIMETKRPDEIGAYCIGAGITGDEESKPVVLKKLHEISQEDSRGYIAVALGLMNARDAIEPIQEIVKKSKYKAELLQQAAIALGLLGDKDLVPELVDMLTEAKSLASQAAISSALGFIGDARSIDPLIDMLQNSQITDRARGFAAVALGLVADKEELPWNAKIAVDINYRASTSTLTSPSQGTGILDIL
jgi:HEAT repeat protein